MATELSEGTVSVVFTDVVGSTARTNEVGDVAARDLFRAVEEIVREQAERHRGIEVKGTGDGQMVAFTSAWRSVLFAVDVQKALHTRRLEGATRQPVTLKIGLNTGEVVQEDDDLFGATVNLDARVADRAGAGEIFVSDTTRGLLGAAPDIELETRGEFDLKGFQGVSTLYSAVWEAKESDEDAAPASGLTPYVGRSAELTTLRVALAGAISGAGNIVLLAGEPGIGKTRLSNEIMAEARADGAFVAAGYCYEMEGTPPFVPFSEALSTTPPE